MELEDIKKNYRKFDDAKITDLATAGARQLRHEVVPILVQEIHRRNLPLNLIDAIVMQRKKVDPAEIEYYCDLIRHHKCPECGSRTGRLNAIALTEVISCVLFSQNRQLLRIACRHCLEDISRKVRLKTVLLGWWKFPSGVTHTLSALAANAKAAAIIQSGAHSPAFKAFVLENIGTVESKKDNPKSLDNFLKRINRQ